MTRTLRALALALTIALTTPAALAKPKTGEPPKPPKKKEERVVGVLLKVVENKLTLQTFGKTAGEVTVVTDKNTKFSLEAEPAALADIKPGLQIVATPATGVAKSIVASKIKVKDKNKDKDK